MSTPPKQGQTSPAPQGSSSPAQIAVSKPHRVWSAVLLALAIAPLLGLWLNMFDRHRQWTLIDEAHWAAEGRYGSTIVDSLRHFIPLVVSTDLDAGRFRPLYDLVSFIEYQVPPWALLAIRGIQLLAVAGVLSWLAACGVDRRTDPQVRATFFAFGAVLIASIPGFWTSMTWSSFQELPGLFFVVAVLAVRRTPGGAVLGLLVAGLYKEPFAFAAAAAALVLYVDSRTTRRLILLIASTLLVLGDTWVSSQGSYTGSVTNLANPPS